LIEFYRATNADCATAQGTVVVVDVIRAFSTTAYAFSKGAKKILLTDTPENAFALRLRFADALLMGEINGLPIAGFDFGNSPSQIAAVDLSGRTLIQRTSAGTQGMVRSVQAQRLLAGSFVCAQATANYIRQLSHERVTFVITGVRPGADFNRSLAGWGDEDAACADYIESIVLGQALDPTPFLQRVRNSPAGLALASSNRPGIPPEDLEWCLALDRFNFAMPVQRENGLLAMRRVSTL
jgi:2-phosphosulfolactate phosphatase